MAQRDLIAADAQRLLREELVFQLKGGNAHAPMQKVLRGVPREKRGELAQGLPYSLWQLLEHMRIAQHDILNFCSNGEGSGYQEMNWPGDYWPKSPRPTAEDAWEISLAQFNEDLRSMCEAVGDPRRDLLAPFAWGGGQTLLREAMVLVDHNSYHLGEMVAVRRVLGIWK